MGEKFKSELATLPSQMLSRVSVISALKILVLSSGLVFDAIRPFAVFVCYFIVVVNIFTVIYLYLKKQSPPVMNIGIAAILAVLGIFYDLAVTGLVCVVLLSILYGFIHTTNILKSRK